MLDAKVAELLNTQINKEFYSAYLYLDFANYYTEEGHLTVLPTGTISRRRRSGIMLCSF